MRYVAIAIVAIAGIALVTVGMFLTLVLTLVASAGSEVESSRVRSPNGALDAVLVERDGGAATQFLYDIYIVKRGAEYSGSSSVMQLYAATQNSRYPGATLKWTDPTELEIDYFCAESMQVYYGWINVDGQTVHIVWRAGVSNSPAPTDSEPCGA